MINLLQETIEFIHKNGKTVDDVKWIRTDKGCFSWKDFENIANIDYDKGFGNPEINEELMIVGGNWWMERHEYDGSEWWEFKRMPRKGKDYIPESADILTDYGMECLEYKMIRLVEENKKNNGL